MFKKIKYSYLIVKYQLIDIYNLLYNIFIGYYNWCLSYFDLMDELEVEKYNKKASLCTSECPLRGKVFGVTVCDARKSTVGLDGYDVEGCGCVISAKLWSDSPCPLGKF